MPLHCVLVNCCYGGFNLSDQARAEYRRRVGKDDVRFLDLSRSDPVMVEIVRELGVKASGISSSIQIREIDSKYADHFEIGEYDGMEWVRINYDHYALDRIRQLIVSGDVATDAKLSGIMDILAENEANRVNEDDGRY